MYCNKITSAWKDVMDGPESYTIICELQTRMNKQTNKQTNRQTNKQTNKQASKQANYSLQTNSTQHTNKRNKTQQKKDVNEQKTSATNAYGKSNSNLRNIINGTLYHNGWALAIVPISIFQLQHHDCQL